MSTLLPDGYTDPQDSTNRVAPEKILSETALLVLGAAAVANSDPLLRDQVEALAQVLVPHARSNRVLLGSVLEPSLSRDYALAHACLSRLGFADAVFDRQFEQCLRSETADGRERLPHRDLEQQWLRRVWDPTHCSGGLSDLGLARCSMLGKQLNVLSASRDDVYALTHAVMYFTDLGSRRIRLPRSGQAIAADAEAALARCLDEQDYDLAGELLLTWPYLRRPRSTVATFAFGVLTRVEDQVNFLPSLSTRVDRFMTLESTERSRYALATAYHTIYVMGLLCAATMRFQAESPRVVGRPSRRPNREVGSAIPLLRLVDNHPQTPHWRRFLTELPPCDQDSLASFLLTIVLQRSARARDFETIRAGLEIGVQFHLVSTPAPRQAAELLRRVAHADSRVNDR